MTKKQPMKAARGWAVIFDYDKDMFMSSALGKKRFWARIIRVRKDAEAMYPDGEIVPVLITPIKNPTKR